MQPLCPTTSNYLSLKLKQYTRFVEAAAVATELRSDGPH
jgi:hypothetical protein